MCIRDSSTFTVHSLAAVDREILVAANGQGAKPSRDPRFARGHQFLPAVEVALVELDTEAEPCFERVVEQGQVGAVVAVALLHAERIEHAIAAGLNLSLIHISEP